MISQRTTAGLKAAKVRGVVLGATMDAEKAAKVRATLNGLVAAKLSLRQIAAELNRMEVTTPRQKSWTAQAMKNALGREELARGMA